MGVDILRVFNVTALREPKFMYDDFLPWSSCTGTGGIRTPD